MTDAEAPPAKRQVVVLRAGPPKRRGAIVDAIVGIIGVFLIVAAFSLGQVLPEEEVPPKQFLPEFDQLGNTEPHPLTDPDWPGEPGAGEFSASLRYIDPLPEGDVRTIEAVIDKENIYQFQIQVTFPGDDIASSLPDRLQVQLFAPNGTEVVGADTTLVTKDPKEVDAQSGSTAMYESEIVSKTITFRLPAVPTADFITSNSTDFTAADALRIANELYTRDTTGTWIFQVTLLDAGDCPSPTGGDARRALACNQETSGDGTDGGNPYTVGNLQYNYYTIQVPDPEEAGEEPSL